MLFEKLTDQEKALIEYFRHNYNEYEDDHSFFTGSYVDTKTFLRYWEEAKAPLIDAFGGNLIIKKPVQSIVEDEDLHDKIGQVYWMYEWKRFRGAVCDLVKRYNSDSWIARTIPDVQSTSKMSLEEVFCWYVFTVDAMVENKYDGPTVEVSVGNGKTIKMVRGCKLMKICGKFAKELPSVADCFEIVRLRHSQVMNEANIKANLCLSIHPLDFMTASYNSNDWRSCMNWEDGEFRRGVIEMMNSPIVVCAYLESKSSNMSWCIGELGHTEIVEWNSKKWREFFIVRPDVISGIKGYPYWNRTLEDETLNWMREIFGPIFHSDYADDIQKWKVDERVEDTKNGISLRDVRMECGPAMYNDFYTGHDYHSIFVKDLKLRTRLCIDYSGASECVVCGEVNDFDNEGTFCCQECVHPIMCSICGEALVDFRYAVEHNGNYYCEYCYEHLPKCDCCGEHYDPNRDECFEFCIGRDEETTTDVIRRAPSGIMRQPGAVVHFGVCEDCYNEIFIDGAKEVLKPNKWFESWFDCYRIVPLSHLTENARRTLLNETDLNYFLGHPEDKAASA